MQRYGIADVERMLRLSRSTIRALVQAGFVTPERGPRRSLRFSFRDLVVLRTAQALVAANVPAKRITRSLKQLRQQLPDEMPLSGLRIGAIGQRVVVRDGDGHRQVDTGQYLLGFDGEPSKAPLGLVACSAPQPPAGRDWYVHGLSLEASDPDGAIKAYRQAIVEEPERVDVRVNLGCLLHERGRHAEAERVYLEAIDETGDDPLVCYNLGVLLDDLGRVREAIHAYERAVRADPSMADGHFNLSLLYEKLGRPREAIRSMSQYRRLVDVRVE